MDNTIVSEMSYTTLSENLFFGIHPSIVLPNFQPAHYVILCPEVERIDSESDVVTTNPNLVGERKVFEHLEQPDPGVSVYYFDIRDRGVPTPLVLFQLATEISKLEGTVYIACRGGHGRSGAVAGAVHFLKSPETSKTIMACVKRRWSECRDMSYLRPIIRKLGSPQTAKQKRNLHEMCVLVESEPASFYHR